MHKCSYFQLLISDLLSNLQSCLCQYVKDLLALKGMVEIVELNHFA